MPVPSAVDCPLGPAYHWVIGISGGGRNLSDGAASTQQGHVLHLPVAGCCLLRAWPLVRWSALKARGQFESPLYAAIDGRLAAMVAVVDPIKAATSAAIAAPTSWA